MFNALLSVVLLYEQKVRGGFLIPVDDDDSSGFVCARLSDKHRNYACDDLTKYARPALNGDQFRNE